MQKMVVTRGEDQIATMGPNGHVMDPVLRCETMSILRVVWTHILVVLGLDLVKPLAEAIGGTTEMLVVFLTGAEDVRMTETDAGMNLMSDLMPEIYLARDLFLLMMDTMAKMVALTKGFWVMLLVMLLAVEEVDSFLRLLVVWYCNV